MKEEQDIDPVVIPDYPVEVEDDDGFPREKYLRVREMVLSLIDHGNMTPLEIAEALDGRVSSRTIYRWSKGQTCPQNDRDYQALTMLYQQKTGK
jgi:hypothetical protein